MKTIEKLTWVNVILFLIFVLALMFGPIRVVHATPQPDDPGKQESILVGRISHVEGELLRYVPEDDAWVSTVKDEPFYTDDLLRSDEAGRAEFIVPNNTWMRIDHNTQVEPHTLRDDLTEIYVAFGLARFQNNGSYAVIKATTPFGYVMAPEETSFDLYVGPDSVEVIPLKGSVDFFHNALGTRFQVIAGKSGILADSRQVTPSLGDVDPDWDSWNRDREYLWATRSRLGKESETYLPPSLQYDAYVLEEQGRWERVYYDGAYAYFWRPVYVSAGWAPFTVGRWTVYYGDNVWIPCEPFGYVTHHYGNWVFIGDFWYWAPPVARVRVHVGPPLLDIGLAWYPGRVAWIYSGLYIGWVPLAPYEPYYCHRRWGPRAVVVKNVNITNININKYTYVKHAVVINKRNLYSVKNYTGVRVSNRDHGPVARKYRVAPVLNNGIVNDYKNLSQRHQFENAHVQQKPDQPVGRQVPKRHKRPEQRVESNVKTVRQDVPDARPGGRAETISVHSTKAPDSKARSNRVDTRVQKNDSRQTSHSASPRVEPRVQPETRKETQIIRTGKPVRSARQQEVRPARQQQHTIKQVPKVQTKTASPPANQQDVPVEAKREVQREEQTSKKESRITPRNNPHSQAPVRSNDSRTTGEQTRWEPQPQQSQPRQQSKIRSGGNGRNAGRRNF